ncbi:hypothetical protein FDP41_002943 [Naegleria fowleri]|uniref:Uncharacterized protein n=1 Tax=Naegleria fowleri TaxID=5763 RepID=A0A6A5BUG4_NAEFO|nr:uncharacterized protein FDP41_002943 [Naegleria fowleri]KAF0978051.1 hypothetical protein FDP41_002943 [Naegleria fowleri]
MRRYDYELTTAARDSTSKTESIIKLKSSLESIIHTGQQIDIHSLKKLCYLAVIDKCYLSFCAETSIKESRIAMSEEELISRNTIDITKLKIIYSDMS